MSTKRMSSGITAVALLTLCCLTVLWAAPQEAPSFDKADGLFERKHYKEAGEVYEALVEAQHENWHRAAERLIMCRLRLSLYDDAVAAAEDYVARTAGTQQEPRAERLTAHLYMLLPHWGTRAGGKFYRGEHKQGIYLYSWQHDKNHAVAHMERARALYAEHEAKIAERAARPEPVSKELEDWRTERIECVFDLVNLLSRFSIYDDQPQFWHRWWAQRDDFLAETAGEDDFEEGYSYWEMHRKRPIGLRIGPDGEPLFPKEPPAYSPDLPDDEKILYLLAETRKLDTTKERSHTGLSYYRQAMLARKRFGMDRLNSYAGYYGPLKEELEAFNPWELADVESLILVGGRIRKVKLPDQFDVFGLLRRVAGQYVESGVADQAWYAVGLYYQSRQQYLSALDEYEALRETYPRSEWSSSAGSQIARIKQPQVQISQTGVQLPDRPAMLQISHRNMDKVWFVARKVDSKALLEELRAEVLAEEEDSYRYFSMLQHWHHNLTTGHVRYWQTELAAKHLGGEVARWTDPVQNDGTHRYAQADLQTPLTEAGTYLVYAYTRRPEASDAEKTGVAAVTLGASRAVVVLTDLAIVEKKTDKGNLYYVADAAAGAPVPGANVSVLE
ncbi:MAG: tetratricopeptide repeat protein, partial [Planctomycetota bacterium]